FAGLTARWDLTKPVIAAVNGVAMGGGFEVALACDIILASETAVFALPEPKVGLAALAGGLHRLPRTIGIKRAMAMILIGRSVPAAEGKALGFVHEVTAPEALMDAARALAAQICELSPMSVRASKQTVMASLDTPSLQDAFDGQFTHAAVKALFQSDDVREGPLAFAQKRKPEWKGRERCLPSRMRHEKRPPGSPPAAFRHCRLRNRRWRLNPPRFPPRPPTHRTVT
ncbi:MAG: enoyl-CoA hydratase/isomerase family protein, partial [Sandarakinorhabdus sp.]|nr:enoyl-CoA hydratase/isomerase family protein [Sandarakinorhabdus sp.]